MRRWGPTLPRASAWWGLSAGRRPTLVSPCSMESSWRWTRSMPWAATSAARWSWSSRTTGPTPTRAARCRKSCWQRRSLPPLAFATPAWRSRPSTCSRTPKARSSCPAPRPLPSRPNTPRPTATSSACKGATRSRRRSSWTTSSNAAGTRSPFLPTRPATARAAITIWWPPWRPRTSSQCM